MRHFINIVVEADRATLSIPRIMVMVHPGSACGSADFNLGRSQASADRDGLMNDLTGWTGHLLIVDGELSEELADYPRLNSAIETAISRCGGERIVADDNDGAGWVATVIEKLHKMGVGQQSEVIVTGAWYWPNGEAGCVNAVHNALHAAGVIRATISDNAVVDTAGESDPDDSYEDGEEEN